MIKKNSTIHSSQQQPLQWADIFAVGGSAAVFAAASLWTITRSSVWFDEAFGAYMIRFSFWDIVRYTANDVHPPLYYWLLKLWSYVFGTSELALRSMSTFFGVVMIVFAYLLLRRVVNRSAATLGVVFVALSPMIIRYSQEMRMYMLVTAIAVVATYVLVLAMQYNKKKYWAIYGALLAAGMWTHYFAALVWCAHLLWHVWNVRQEAKPTKGRFVWRVFTREWRLAYGVAAAVFAAWIPALGYQVVVVQAGGFWIPKVTVSTVPNFFTNMLYYLDYDLVSPWLTLVFIGLCTLLVAWAARVYAGMDATERQWYRLVASVAIVPVALLIVVSMPPLRSAFIERYLIPAAAFFALFGGVVVAYSARFVRPMWTWAVVLVVVVVSGIGVYNVQTYGNYSKTARASNNTREIMQAIARVATPGQPIIADSPWLFYEAVYYTTNDHPVYFIDAKTQYKYGSLDMMKYNDDHKIKDMTEFAKAHPTIWYVGHHGDGDPADIEAGWARRRVVTANDSMSGKTAYKAIEFQIVR